MRISINAVSPYEGGGFNTYNKYIIQSICKIDKKNDYFIFVDSNNFDQHKINQPNVKIIKKNKILNNSVLRILWMQLILPIELIKLDIDTHLSTMNILPFLLSLTKIKSVLVQHSNLPWVYPNEFEKKPFSLNLRKYLMSISIYLADKIICDTDYAKLELIKFFPNQKKKFNFVYLGVDRENFKRDSKNKNLLDSFGITKPYLLCIASSKPYHRILELIRGYQEFIKYSNESISLIIITNIHDKEYYRKIIDVSSVVNFNIKIITGIDSNYIPTILSNAEIYIFPSVCEVFGLTNIEAMSCGVPVLTSKLSAMPEVCGEAAEYFDPNDIRDIKNVISNLFYNDLKKIDLIRKGNIRANELSWDITAKKTLEVLTN
tara:strand:+ start:977 stop:2101 length:1125 start_codon:yes stop_codon:yes gene_type:complete